ncbi:MAG: hypothetical protein JSU60_03785 [Nitrospirota bacterium]|nr:MAG: hypothetical protein JSU60_03785 [Nitrospirota bacterium]
MRNAFLQLWLIVWVITLPLVHIHPEADHAHGMSGHVHGGTYHSILINTPVHSHQDHKTHHHDDVFFPGEAFGPSQSSSHPFQGFEEATYGFSVIKSSVDLESEKLEFPNDLVSLGNVESLRAPGSFRHNVKPSTRLVSILPTTLFPRAPPVLSM